MENSRRSFIRHGVGSALATAILPAVHIHQITNTAQQGSAVGDRDAGYVVQPKERIKLSISSYSYWHLTT